MSSPATEQGPRADGTDIHADSAGPSRKSHGKGILAAAAYLFPTGRIGRSLDADAFSRAGPWIVPWGLAIGLAWVAIFRATWRLFGDTAGLRLIPSISVILLEGIVTGALLLAGLATTVHVLGAQRPLGTGGLAHRPPAPRSGVMIAISFHAALAVMLALLLQWTLILSIPVEQPWWPSTGWRRHFNFMYPAPHYRPLILAPLWGRWGLLVASCVGRTSRHADAETVALCGAMRPALLLRRAILPLALSIIYFARDGAYLTGVIAGLVTFGVTYVAAVIMARRDGGQTRHSLWCAALIAQITFLAVHRAFWPLIHR